MLIPGNFLADTSVFYLSKVKRRSVLLYISLLLFIIVCLSSLYFVYIDISVKTAGITRPISERTEVKPVIGGIIDTLFYKEGDSIKKDAILLAIKDPATKGKRIVNEFETKQREDFIHDLQIITTVPALTENILSELISPLYKEQLNKFLHQKQEQDAALKKATKEVDINTPLAKERIISPKEFFDIQNNLERVQSNYKAFMREQLIIWQQDLARYRLELSQYRQQLQQVNTDAGYYQIKAPVAGIIQGISTRYAGGLIQANETLCSISPEGSLIGECYVQTKDIGLLKQGQTVQYQIEAFDYNYFGILTGKIVSIDNDYTVSNNTPVFKVRCSFDSTQLHLKNGFTGQLKKGLNFQARFIVARRSLWQLLYDKLNDWLNPVAPPTTTATNN